jgi:hypothetical protein
LGFQKLDEYRRNGSKTFEVCFGLGGLAHIW